MLLLHIDESQHRLSLIIKVLVLNGIEWYVKGESMRSD